LAVPQTPTPYVFCKNMIRWELEGRGVLRIMILKGTVASDEWRDRTPTPWGFFRKCGILKGFKGDYVLDTD
jgi:hypothetical protein